MEVDKAITVPQVMSGIGGTLMGEQKLIIKQDLSLLEGVTQGCCEKSNVYRIAGGEDGDRPLYIAKERSSCCTRCCCAPFHSYFVEILDVNNPKGDPLLTLERLGCQCFFPTAPRPCLPCGACSECCTERIVVHDGAVDGSPGHVTNPNPVSIIKQPACGGGCTPTLEIVPPGGEEDKPLAVVEGPMCFGGCSELCCTNHFPVSRTAGKEGELGEIQHLRPTGLCSCCTECCTDTDRFGVEFSEQAQPIDRANMLAATIVVDYMFFEQDNGMCDCSGNTASCTLCLCYCYGCFIPCNFCVPKGSS